MMIGLTKCLTLSALGSFFNSALSKVTLLWLCQKKVEVNFFWRIQLHLPADLNNLAIETQLSIFLFDRKSYDKDQVSNEFPWKFCTFRYFWFPVTVISAEY